MPGDENEEPMGDFGLLSEKLAAGCLTLGSKLNLNLSQDLSLTKPSSSRQPWKKGCKKNHYSYHSKEA